MKYAVGFGIGIFLIIGLYYAITIPPSDVSDLRLKNTITIGFVGPLTGDMAQYGQSIKNAIFLAVKDLKTQGKNIEVVYEDGICDGNVAVRVLNKLIEVDRVKAVIGGICNGETLAMAPVAEQGRVILFSPSASSPDVTNVGSFIFRNSPSDTAVAEYLARAVRATYSPVALVTESVDSVAPFKDAFVARFTGDGGTVALDERFSSDQKDFKQIIKKIKGSDAQVIMVIPQTEEVAGVFMKQLRKAGVSLPVYGTSAVGGSKFTEAAGDAADGMIFADIASLDAQNPQAQAFLNDYKKFFGEPSQEFYLASAYDAVSIIAQAVERVGYDGLAMRDYLYNLPEYDGLIGKYSFDLNGDVVGPLVGLKVINKGKVERYTY